MEAIIEKSQLQTIAWRHNIANKTGADPTSPSDLGTKTGIRKQYWSRYLNWGLTGNREKSNPPNEVIRNLLEVGDPKENIIAIKGSKNVYDIGPENAPLWAALLSNDQSELWDIAKSISKNVQLHEAIINQQAGEYSCHDYPNFIIDLIDIYIEAVIKYAQEALKLSIPTDNHHCHLNPTQENSLDNLTAINIHDLTALLAAYRLCHFCLPEKIEYQFSLRDCIEAALDDSNLAKSLSSYGILDDITNVFFNFIPQPENCIIMIPTLDYGSTADETTQEIQSEEVSREEFDRYLYNKFKEALIRSTPTEEEGLEAGEKTIKFAQAFSYALGLAKQKFGLLEDDCHEILKEKNILRQRSTGPETARFDYKIHADTGDTEEMWVNDKMLYSTVLESPVIELTYNQHRILFSLGEAE